MSVPHLRLAERLINYNQTNRGRTPKSSVTRSESLAAINDTTTTKMIISRKISFATEGLQPRVERVRTSNENALTNGSSSAAARKRALL